MAKLDNLTTNQRRWVYIGIIASYATHIEYFVEVILLSLLNMDQDYGGATIRWISKRKQIDLIKQISKDRHGENSIAYKKINDCMNTVNNALDERHDAVHSFYGDEIEPNIVFKFSFKRGDINLEADEISNEELLEKANNIKDALTTVLALFQEKIVTFPIQSLGKFPQ